MSLAWHEIEKVWYQRRVVLETRRPRSILEAMCVLPILLILPLLAARFATTVLVGSVVASSTYVIYSGATYKVWCLWSRSSRLSLPWQRTAILLVMGFDSLSLLFISLTFLSATMLATGYAYPFGDALAAASLTIYIAEIGFLLMRAPAILSRTLRQPNARASWLETRWIAGIQSALVGSGVVLGAIFSRNPHGWIVGIGLGLLGAFLLLPFAVFGLYQVAVLARHGISGNVQP